MTKCEKETIINWNMEDDYAVVYTCQRGIWQKLERMGMKAVTEYKQEGEIIAKEFKIAKSQIGFRRASKSRSLPKNHPFRAKTEPNSNH